MKKNYKYHFLALLAGVGISTSSLAGESDRNRKATDNPFVEWPSAIKSISGNNSGIIESTSSEANFLEIAAIVVSGQVTDENGEGLPGVTIRLKDNASVGTVTDLEGNYRLSVPDGADEGTLVFSFVGYLNEERPISNRSTIDVQLMPDIKSLDEVVVVGYGTQRKKDVTGSIVTVSPDEFNKGVVATPDQLLAGKVPGLVVNRPGGDPTAASTMQLRGPSSLTASSAPFYVIDGVPGADINLVAPDQIQSIDVLKDASATAIYGSRAANGVIMVTTKQGKAGKPVLTYSGYGAVENVANQIDVLNASEYNQFLADNELNISQTEIAGGTNWQDELFRTGISHNHTLGLSGGSEETTYTASVDYFKNEGVVKNNDLERVVARINLNQDLFNERVKLGLSATNSNITSNHIDYRVFEYAARYLPVSPVMGEGAEYDRYGGYFQVPGRTNYFNPVAALNQREESRNRNIFLGSGRLNVNILSGLDLNLIGSFQRENYAENYYQSRNDFDPQALGVGFARRLAVQHTEKIFESTLNYAKELADRHSIKALAGYSYQYSLRDNGINVRNNGFASDALGANNLSRGGIGDVNHFDEFPLMNSSTLVSVFGRVNYGFADRYLLTATVRRDGSSRFGANNKWATFPSVSGAWRISEENFMEDLRFIYDLKLRVGYGISGNQGIDPYRSRTLYGRSDSQFMYNGEWTNSVGVTQNPNPDLKWESTSMLNIGLDFALLEGRLNGTVEYYDKQTNDLLFEYEVPTPPYLFNRLLANGATMSNKGVELSLDATIVRKDNWGWSSAFNVARNKNRIGDLESNVGNLNVSERYEGEVNLDGWTGERTTIVRPGLPVGTFFVPKYVGYDEAAQTTIYETPAGELVTADQLDTRQHQQIMGYALPDYTFGWSNTFNYKSIDLNFFFRGVQGNEIYNATRADLSRLNQATSFNLSRQAVEEGIMDAPLNSSRWIEDGSFIRLDYATLGYNFNVEGLKNISRARIYLTGQNLLVLTNYSGVDPEVAISGLAPGIDNRNYYPRTRSFILGVNLSF